MLKWKRHWKNKTRTNKNVVGTNNKLLVHIQETNTAAKYIEYGAMKKKKLKINGKIDCTMYNFNGLLACYLTIEFEGFSFWFLLKRLHDWSKTYKLTRTENTQI